MSKVKAVIFDMDGLMFDTETIYYRANQKIADELGMDYSFEDYQEYIGASDDVYFPEMERRFADVKGIGKFQEKSINELEHQLVHGELKIKPGLLELLDYLKKNEVVAVVASSTRRELVGQLLEKTGVRPYFKAFIGGDEVENAKPDPAIFNKAFEKTGISDKKNAIVLEDSKNGILAAEAAGISVIHIPDLLEIDQATKDKTEAIYDDLHEVIKYIEDKNK